MYIYDDDIYFILLQPSSPGTLLLERGPVSHIPKVTDHLAVVFTTFSGSPRKAQLFSNTVKNWASFLPTIQPILFFTEQNSTLTALAESYGWMVAPCPRVNEYGTPFLKNMYTKAYQLVSAPLYGFINGDILFDQSLLRTLHRLIVDLQYLNSTLVTGRRWNYRVQNETSFDAWTPRQVQQLAKSKNSSLSRTDTEDYFFVTKDFPWHEIKDVVIGRPAYDNYLVARSIQLNITTIDASDTITAMHQTGKYKDRATKKDGNINKKIIGKFNYYAGLTSEMWLKTKYDYKGEVFVDKHKINNSFLETYLRKFQAL